MSLQGKISNIKYLLDNSDETFKSRQKFEEMLKTTEKELDELLLKIEETGYKVLG